MAGPRGSRRLLPPDRRAWWDDVQLDLLRQLGHILAHDYGDSAAQELLVSDTVLLNDIGHYPQIEAPEQVLAGYLAFRSKLEQGS